MGRLINDVTELSLFWYIRGCDEFEVSLFGFNQKSTKSYLTRDRNLNASTFVRAFPLRTFELPVRCPLPMARAPLSVRVQGSRILPSRVRNAPERFGEFTEDDADVARPRARRAAVDGQCVSLREVSEKEPLAILLPTPPVESLFPPGFAAEYDGDRMYIPQRCAFGRLANGTYSGFYDENFQVFRCGSETAYWAIVSELPPLGRNNRRLRSFQTGPFWTIVSLKEVRVVAPDSSRLDPECVVGFWCNGPQEVFYKLQRFHGQIPSNTLATDIWSYEDGWDGVVPASSIRYAAHVTPYVPGMILSSADHVAMRGVNLLAPTDPIKVDRCITLPPNALTFNEFLRVQAAGIELDPPSLSCLRWASHFGHIYASGKHCSTPSPCTLLQAGVRARLLLCSTYHTSLLPSRYTVRYRRVCSRSRSASCWEVCGRWHLPRLLGGAGWWFCIKWLCWLDLSSS